MGGAALPDKPDRAGFAKRAELDMQRHEKEGNSKEEENIPGGELGGSHGGRGEERAGGYGDRRCCSLRENRLFGADQLDRNPGLGMALSGVFLGMHGRDGHERAKKKKIRCRKGQSGIF